MATFAQSDALQVALTRHDQPGSCTYKEALENDDEKQDEEREEDGVTYHATSFSGLICRVNKHALLLR